MLVSQVYWKHSVTGQEKYSDTNPNRLTRQIPEKFTRSFPLSYNCIKTFVYLLRWTNVINTYAVNYTGYGIKYD